MWKPCLCILRLFLAVLLLLFLCIIWPVFLFRFFLSSFLAPIFRRDIKSTISAQSNAVFFPSTNPTFNVVVKLALRGKLDYNRILQHFTSKCILAKSERGKFLHPEFQRFPTVWFGFGVWQNEAKFKIQQHSRHVFLENSEEVDHEFMRILQTPFEAHLSPWEISLIETKENPDIYHICFKFHHLLGDGASILNCLLQATDEACQVQPIISDNNLSFYSKLVHAFQTFISFFRILHELVIELSGGGEKSLAGVENALTGVRFSTIVDPIRLDDVKRLRDKFNVCTTSILLALVAGAVRQKAILDGKWPKNPVELFLPVPVPNHPKGLFNKIPGFVVTLPVEITDGAQRVHAIEKQIQRELRRNSMSPRYFFHVLYGLLPRFMITPDRTLYMDMSIFVGPKTQVSVSGNTVEDIAFVLCGGTGSALAVNMMSYNGRIQIWINGDQSICPSQEKIECYPSLILNELKELGDEPCKMSTGVIV